MSTFDIMEEEEGGLDAEFVYREPERVGSPATCIGCFAGILFGVVSMIAIIIFRWRDGWQLGDAIFSLTLGVFYGIIVGFLGYFVGGFVWLLYSSAYWCCVVGCKPTLFVWLWLCFQPFLWIIECFCESKGAFIREMGEEIIEDAFSSHPELNPL